MPTAFRACSAHGGFGALICLVLIFNTRAPAADEDAAKKVVVVCDHSLPPVAFAAGEICEALKETGYSTTRKSPEEAGNADAPWRIVLSVVDPDSAESPAEKSVRDRLTSLGRQGYTIVEIFPDASRQASLGFQVISSGPAGAMYGGLEVAESIRLHRGLEGISETAKGPYILRRGIKFNIPLDARTPSYDDTGDAAQKNYTHMWDFSFWEGFLDAMARHRYNTLTLWNPHPFPSLVKCPNYPDVALDDVCVSTLKPTYRAGAWRDPMFVHSEVFGHLKVVRKMTIRQKIAFWRRVMQHAKDRGIDVYFITWNVLTNGTRGKYGITDEQDNPKTIAYLRECVRECVLTYPLLAGVGVTAGENMETRDDEFSKQMWLWQTYGLGILDAKQQQPDRHVRFLHRVWQTGVDGVLKDFGSKYPDTFELGFKYARAHMYSSPRPPFAEQLCEEMKPHGVKCWWNLRNDDLFNFRWGDPDYVRKFLLNLPPEELTAGYHMGSDGYVWGREHTSTEPESPRQLEIDKHWYRFMLWGRLGYDPKLDGNFFEKVLAARFPQVSGAYLYATWTEASKIVPLVNRFHWCDWDFMWAVEACMDQRKGFHTVDDFIKIGPMERSGIVSIAEFVDRQLAGQTAEGTTPIQVAKQLRRHAEDTLTVLAQMRRKTPEPAKELRLTLDDIEAMAHLGNYYAAKILGAVELHAHRQSKDAKRREAAIGHLKEAVKHWESYAGVASRLYRPQLLARTRRTEWMKILEDVKKDVEIARGASAP